MTAIPTNSSLLLSYKLQRGISDQSYGLFIAKMAGIPEEILLNAEKYLKEKKTSGIEKKLEKIDINSITPLQALQLIAQLKQDSCKLLVYLTNTLHC